MYPGYLPFFSEVLRAVTVHCLSPSYSRVCCSTFHSGECWIGFPSTVLISRPEMIQILTIQPWKITNFPTYLTSSKFPGLYRCSDANVFVQRSATTRCHDSDDGWLACDEGKTVSFRQNQGADGDIWTWCHGYVSSWKTYGKNTNLRNSGSWICGAPGDLNVRWIGWVNWWISRIASLRVRTFLCENHDKYMSVSENRGTPKSSILIGIPL